jgi:hypothetical protein
MNDSRSPHGALTEDVRENVSGKGREGNREGKGTRVEAPIHSSGSVTRAARPGWMGMNR